MNLTKLRNNQVQLIEFMEKGGYSTSYIRSLKYELNKLLKYGESYENYLDYYENFIKKISQKNLKNKRIRLTIIMNFDLYNMFPNRKKHKNRLINNSSYKLLNDNFKIIVDTYKNEVKNNIKNTTIHNDSLCCSRFLMHLQNLGYKNLNNVKESDVLSFFLDENGNLKFSNSYETKIRIVLKKCASTIEDCKKIIDFLPKIKHIQKNIDYLTSEEIEKIKEVLNNPTNSINLRDKAIVSLLLYTGIRACDIANLRLSNINWIEEKIEIVQAKTNIPLELPLTTSVGNALFNYITKERPVVDFDNVFIRLDANYPITKGCIRFSVIKVFNEAGIRQTNEKRKGTHIFRYNLASSLLKNEIPQPIISQVLGHISPTSLEFYLSADFYHLKQCALNIELFENIKEVSNHD